MRTQVSPFPFHIALTIIMMSGAVTDRAAQAQTRDLGTSRHTNGAGTRQAFSEVVQQANAWTVRVISGRQQVALGVIVGADGHILTKASQLQGEVTCRLADGRLLPADFVGHHEEHDLALLKVDAEGLPVVQWQAAEDPAVGRWVATPDQQGAPIAVGVVSVGRRSVPEVQTRGVLGIRLRDEPSPAIIDRIIPESGAQEARLQPGDIIHKVNGISVHTKVMLVNEIGKYRPGDRLQLSVEREGQSLTIPATLTHPFGEFLSRIAMQNQMGGALSERRGGFAHVIQHDTVLTPEECGGPLVDLSGAAVGINIARAGRTESYAIPDDVIRGLLSDLIAGRYPPPSPEQPVSVVVRKVSPEDGGKEASSAPATPSEQ